MVASSSIPSATVSTPSSRAIATIPLTIAWSSRLVARSLTKLVSIFR